MALVLLPTCLCQQQQQEKGERGGCLITTDRGRWTIAGKEEGTRVWHYVQQLVATQRQERIRCTHSAPPTNRFLFSWAARLDSPGGGSRAAVRSASTRGKTGEKEKEGTVLINNLQGSLLSLFGRSKPKAYCRCGGSQL